MAPLRESTPATQALRLILATRASPSHSSDKSTESALRIATTILAAVGAAPTHAAPKKEALDLVASNANFPIIGVTTTQFGHDSRGSCDDVTNLKSRTAAWAETLTIDVEDPRSASGSKEGGGEGSRELPHD